MTSDQLELLMRYNVVERAKYRHLAVYGNPKAFEIFRRKQLMYTDSLKDENKVTRRSALGR